MINRNAGRVREGIVVVSVPAQREVAVKKPGFSSFSPVRTLAFSLLLALPCYGQEPSGVLKESKPAPADAPLVLQYPNGSALLNKAAFDKIDVEMKRLQQVEREHKAEPSWLIPVAIGAGAGLVVGAVVSAVIVGAVTAK